MKKLSKKLRWKANPVVMKGKCGNQSLKKTKKTRKTRKTRSMQIKSRLCFNASMTSLAQSKQIILRHMANGILLVKSTKKKKLKNQLNKKKLQNQLNSKV